MSSCTCKLIKSSLCTKIPQIPISQRIISKAVSAKVNWMCFRNSVMWRFAGQACIWVGCQFLFFQNIYFSANNNVCFKVIFGEADTNHFIFFFILPLYYFVSFFTNSIFSSLFLLLCSFFLQLSCLCHFP